MIENATRIQTAEGLSLGRAVAFVLLGLGDRARNSVRLALVPAFSPGSAVPI